MDQITFRRREILIQTWFKRNLVGIFVILLSYSIFVKIQAFTNFKLNGTVNFIVYFLIYMGILVFVIRILFTFCKLYRYLKDKHNYEFKRIGNFVKVQVALIGCWTLALALNLAANWPFHGFSESDEKWDEAIQIDYCPANL